MTAIANPLTRPTTNPTQATRELERVRQERARRNLTSFVSYTFPQYNPEPFHQYVAKELQRVVEGKTKRLMIFAPPQHGKSQLTSVHLPAFWLGHNPDMPIILSSYGATLAEKHSREARAVVESEPFGRLFKTVRTQWQSRSVQRWKINNHRGSMLAVGVGGPITGHGAQLAILDDPFSSWEMAYRRRQRDMVWDWYKGTFRTRLWDGGSIVIINTRWHEDDLCGRLLKEQAEQWRVLRFPALAESQADRDLNDKYLGLPTGQPDLLNRAEGEPLCPIRFSKTAMLETKRDVGSSVWSAEYQGVPRPSEGKSFKRHWFQIVPAVSVEIVAWIRYWDRAATEGGGDWTVGILLGLGRNGLYYIADEIRGQWSSGQVEDILLQTIQLDTARYGDALETWIEQEGGSAGKDSAATIVKKLAGYAVRFERPSGSKEVRARPFAAQCEAGNVRLLEGKWNDGYIEELCSFPTGEHDDRVDASTGGFNKASLRQPQEPFIGSFAF